MGTGIAELSYGRPGHSHCVQVRYTAGCKIIMRALIPTMKNRKKEQDEDANRLISSSSILLPL